MANKELQQIWRNFGLEPKPVEELDLLLTSKVRTTISKFVIVRIASVLVSIGLLIFLTLTTIQRLTDVLYIINNSILGVFTLTALVLGLLTLKKLQNYKYDSSMKVWLEARIQILSRELSGNQKWLYLFTIPLLFILTQLTIHVYYENKQMIEVLQNEESVTGLIFGAAVGLAVSYYSVIKIRKFQAANLEFLKDLHKRLTLES